MSNEVLTRAANFEPSSYNADKRTVSVVFASTTEVRRTDYEGPFLEVLSLEPAAVNLAEIIGGPVLDNHDRFSGVKAILGVTENATVDGSRGMATLRFSERPEVEGVVRDIASGVIRKVSCGYSVEEWRIEKRANGSRLKVATKWTPREISFCAIGADPNAKVRSQSTMNDQLQEQVRSVASAVGVTGAFVDDLIQRDVPLEDSRRALIGEAARLSPAIDARAPVPITRDGGTAGDSLVARMADAAYVRVDPSHKPADDARQFVGRRFADLARELLRERGISTFGSDAEVITRGLLTTSDLANVVGVLANKTAAVAYQAAPSGLRVVCRQGPSHPNFKGRNIIRRGELPTLEKVNEHGEFKRGSIVDGKQTYAVETFGKVFGMTRQLLIDDDLGMLADIASGWDMAAREFENAQLVAKLTENAGAGPTLGDNVAMFHTTHANLGTGAGSALQVTALSAARLAMRAQKGLDGTTPINVVGKYLLVPSALETTAEALLTTLYPAEIANVNVFAGTNRLALVVDSRLDDVSTKRWYVLADPAVLPTIEFAYLSGFEGVNIETRNGFDVDGVEIRARLDFGCGGVDFRGCYAADGE